MSVTAEIVPAAARAARAFLDGLGPRPAVPLSGIRRTGFENAARDGFPTRRQEAWRFTDLKPLLDRRFKAAETPIHALDRFLGGNLPTADRIVFVDGRLDPGRSSVGALPAGVAFGSFRNWAEDGPTAAAALFDVSGGAEQVLLSLNAAYFSDGLVLTVPEGVHLTQPVHVVHWNGGGAAHLKSLFRLGAGAKAVIIESFIGAEAGWTNLSTVIELGAGAELGRYVVQNEATDASHTAHVSVRLDAAAKLDGFLLNLGARLARHDAVITLDGDGADCGFSGGYLLSGRQDFTISSLIRHVAPGCSSREVFKGTVDDRAHGAFLGKVHVAPTGQKTDARQLNKTMLLSDRAVMDSKPELEIHADDVKCSHGASVGDLDEASLFYLRSRGIDTEAARRMLIAGFVTEAVDLIEDETARAFVGSALAGSLGGGDTP